MGILSWIVLGLIAGVIAKFLLPGQGPSGWILTILLGIGGAIVGGIIGSYVLNWGDVTGFDIRSIALAIGGAVLLLVGYGFLQKR